MASIFDLHCDTPYNIQKRKFNHVVPEKLAKQRYLGAVFAHFVMPKANYPFVDAIKLLSSTISYVQEKSTLHIVHKYSDLAVKKANIILGVEGGHIFDNTPTQVEALYSLGVRVFTLTWNNSNKLGYSALEADSKGLTKRGRRFLMDMGKLGVIVDLSHASTRTALDVCGCYQGRVMASHSCVRTLNRRFLRNIDDRVIKALQERDGVVGVNFSRYHLGQYTVADHIDYLVQNFSIATAAIGSDFDGVNDAVLKNPTEIGKLERSLAQRGYRAGDIKKIFSENFLRVFKGVSSK